MYKMHKKEKKDTYDTGVHIKGMTVYNSVYKE